MLGMYKKLCFRSKGFEKLDIRVHIHLSSLAYHWQFKADLVFTCLTPRYNVSAQQIFNVGNFLIRPILINTEICKKNTVTVLFLPSSSLKFCRFIRRQCHTCNSISDWMKNVMCEGNKKLCILHKVTCIYLPPVKGILQKWCRKDGKMHTCGDVHRLCWWFFSMCPGCEEIWGFVHPKQLVIFPQGENKSYFTVGFMLGEMLLVLGKQIYPCNQGNKWMMYLNLITDQIFTGSAFTRHFLQWRQWNRDPHKNWELYRKHF